MATTLIVRKSCDVCKQSSDEEDGAIQTIAWSWDGIDHDVDLCGGCKEITEATLSSIKDVSRQTSKAKVTRKKPAIIRGEFPCRDKKCKRVFETSQGRGRHEASMHPQSTN